MSRDLNNYKGDEENPAANVMEAILNTIEGTLPDVIQISYMSAKKV